MSLAQLSDEEKFTYDADAPAAAIGRAPNPSDPRSNSDVRPARHWYQPFHLPGRGAGRHRRWRHGTYSRPTTPSVATYGTRYLSLTVIVPAYNEEVGLPDTLAALQRQTVPPDEIIVVDDCSTDRTREIGLGHGVTVLTPPQNLGSKARAQNYALEHCTSHLVLPVDGDTILADDYIARIKEPFQDPRVMVAAGCVRTRYQKTIWEKGREIEYLFGFHWFRPVQNATNAPVVCSGCCSAFHRGQLIEAGGFPERTMVEDIDWTWTQQIAGFRAVYVADAVAYAAEPDSTKYLRKQLWRWKSGWFQNVRRHSTSMIRRKPWLALWVSLSLLEILISPVSLALPMMWLFVLHHTPQDVFMWWGLGELALMGPPLAYAVVKRRVNPLKVLWMYPAFYVLKLFNFYYDWKAMFVELALVPLGLAKGLTQYEKGHA